MSMKIKKVDDKPMVIHTKKKMNIHKAEAVKDMKTKAVNLKVAGAASLGMDS